jgi:hypothetical protein
VQSALLLCIAGLLFIAGWLVPFSASASMAAARSCPGQSSLCMFRMLHSLTVPLFPQDLSIVRLLLLHWPVVEVGELLLLINTVSPTYNDVKSYVETV